MRLKIDRDRTAFYQWDTNQKLVVEGNGTCREVHFSNQHAQQSLVCEILKENERNVVHVPNSLLQTAGQLYAHCFWRGEDGNETRHAQSFTVIRRPKPQDYVCTETEVLTYRDLDKRVEKLEAGGSFDAAAQMTALIETDMLPAVHDADGKILTDETGRVILRY